MKNKINESKMYFLIIIGLLALFFMAVFFEKFPRFVNLVYRNYDISVREKGYRKYERAHKKLKDATKIPIITYHRIVDHESKVNFFNENEWVNDLDVVDEQLKWLNDNGWKSVDLDEFYCWYNKDCVFDKKTYVLTVDDGEIEAYYNLLPLLEKYNIKATLFAIGMYIPEFTGKLEEPKVKYLGFDIIKKLRKEKSLLSVESHSYNLHRKNISGKSIVEDLTVQELEQDFKNNEKYEFRYLAYPFGYYNTELVNVVANDKNTKMAFKFKKGTYATRADNKYEIARIKITAKTTDEEFKKWFEYAK